MKTRVESPLRCKDELKTRVGSPLHGIAGAAALLLWFATRGPLRFNPAAVCRVEACAPEEEGGGGGEMHEGLRRLPGVGGASPRW